MCHKSGLRLHMFFERAGAHSGPLQSPYQRPFKVIDRHQHNHIVAPLFNGLVERMHRIMKAALKAKLESDPNWSCWGCAQQ